LCFRFASIVFCACSHELADLSLLMLDIGKRGSP